MADVYRAHDTLCAGRTSSPLLESLREEMIILLENFEELTEKWRRRRNRLGKKASDLRKVKNQRNLDIANDFFGQFKEIEKCRQELVALINKHRKDLNKTCEK